MLQYIARAAHNIPAGRNNLIRQRAYHSQLCAACSLLATVTPQGKSLQSEPRAYRKRPNLQIHLLAELVDVRRLLLANQQRHLCHHAANRPNGVNA